jgi:hypothetical protein
MTIAAVVALHAEAERLAGEGAAIEDYFSGKGGVGMRRLAKADPAYVAEDGAEIRMVAELPGNGVAAHEEVAPAVAMPDAAIGDAEEEGKLAARTEGQGFERKALDERLRRSLARKPGGSHLDGPAGGADAAILTARIE